MDRACSNGRVSPDRAGHEARSTLTSVGPGTEGLTGGVLEGTPGRARGDVARVGSRKAQGAIAVDVDALATRNDDVLGVIVSSTGLMRDHSLVANTPTRAF